MHEPSGNPAIPSPAVDPATLRRHPFARTVRRNLRDRGGVVDDATVVVGVSGGADSLALLIALHVVADRPIVAVHVHHHLRDDADADADAEHVAETCRRLGIPLRTEHIEPARESGNLAAAARRLRYETLAAVATEVGSAHVAVAHHADDQLETMLMALARGAGVGGMAAMSWTRPLSDTVALVRPLLDQRRATTESFCRDASMTWVDDPTNRSPDSPRARVRHEVLPVLESIWPDAAVRASRTADQLAMAVDLLDDAVESGFGASSCRSWSRAWLRDLPTALIAAGLRRAALAFDDLTRDRLTAAMLEQVAAAVADHREDERWYDWPGALRVRITATTVSLEGETT